MHTINTPLTAYPLGPTSGLKSRSRVSRSDPDLLSTKVNHMVHSIDYTSYTLLLIIISIIIILDDPNKYIIIIYLYICTLLK